MLKKVVGCSLLFLSGSLQAGTVLEMINRDLANKRESLARTYAQDGRLRFESGGPQDSFAIFKDETFYVFDPQQKTYMAMDRATMKRMAEQINPALKALQEQMASMPPEQRAQMERMLGNKLPGTQKAPVEEVRKTARTGTVAGHSCTYSEILEDGVVHTEVCVVPASALKGSAELYDAAVKVSALVREMVAGIDLPWMKRMMDREMENFDRLGGIPVLSRTFDAGKPIQESTMKSLRSESLAGSLFEIPAGYKAQQMPSMGQ